MSELEPLSEAARAAITDELRAPSDPAARARVAGKLEAALGAAFAATAVGATATAAAPAATKGAVLLTQGKVAAMVGVAVAVGAVAGVTIDRTVNPRAPITQPTPPTTAPSVAPAPVPTPSSAPSEVASAPPSVSASAPAPKPSQTAPATESGDDLARERALIDAARAGLKHGNAAAALDAVQRHEKSFPNGQLREEREGIRILALAALGRTDEAKAWDKKFRARYPESLFRPQIDAALGP